jgi:hypothetical protein
MSEEKTDINLTKEELEILKIISDYLFFDHLKVRHHFLVLNHVLVQQ